MAVVRLLCFLFFGFALNDVFSLGENEASERLKRLEKAGKLMILN